MGLFDKRENQNSSTPQDNPSRSNTAEFDNLVKELMTRDDIQDRTDICEHIYTRAYEMTKNPTKETIFRAYNLMGNLATQFSYIPAMLWMGDFAENVLNKDETACIWYKRAADLGSGVGAKNYADMLMTGKGVQRNSTEALQYYEYAMQKNVPEAAFVMGEVKRVRGDREGARAAYQKALDLGYDPARRRLEQME